MGDQFLIKVAEVLRNGLRAHDSVARLGGDEFALVLTELQRPEDCHALLDRLLARINRPVTLDAVRHQVSASIGVTVYPTDRSDPDALLRHADQAMYRAKQSGKNLYQLYDPKRDGALQSRPLMFGELTRAIEQNALILHFQPQVVLVNRRVVGAEALVRWQHPQKGLLPPGEFLPEIEGSHLEPPLSDWVIETALRQLDQWNRQGLHLRIGINVSAGQLMAPQFAGRLREQLERHASVKPEQVELEVLESTAFSDFDQARRVLSECHALGVRFALDDFGTGYSSLAYLRTLPVDVLKIDQSFVCDMLDDPSDMSIVESVVSLSQAFNRSVIAEGVETEAQAALLTWLGCRYGQGYGIARPMPATELPGWVRHWSDQTGWPGANETESHNDMQLMVAAQDHLRWVNRVLRVLNAQDSHQTGELSADACAFGRWYRGRGAECFGGLAAYQAIGPVHQRMHALANELLALAEMGQAESARSRVQELHAARGTVIRGLASLVRAVQSTKTAGNAER